MLEYYKAVVEAEKEGKISQRHATMLLNRTTVKTFYLCLEKLGYMYSIFDDRHILYPWME